MFSVGFFSSLPVTLGIFLVSLIVVIKASTQFTRKLEKLCEEFHLSIGVLSLLSALGANIPNYVSSAIAIAGGQDDVGIGIIVGSNIYNIAVILGLCTFWARTSSYPGITLDRQEKRDVGVIAGYAFVIMLLTSMVIFWLPGEPLLNTFHVSNFAPVLFLPATIVALITFGAQLVHTLRRSHGIAGTALHHREQSPLTLGTGPTRETLTTQFVKPGFIDARYNAHKILGTIALRSQEITRTASHHLEHSPLILGTSPTGQTLTTQFVKPGFIDARYSAHKTLDAIALRSQEITGTTLHHHKYQKAKIHWSTLRLIGEVALTLVIALGGVLVMVQAGQALTDDLQMPSVLAGLLVLAVATSLPNTVVAINLVRTGETAACVEEVCSSGSMNAVLGIVLPLVFWQNMLLDRYLLLLDTPLLLVLTAGTFFGVLRGRIGRNIGILLLVTYAIWVFIRFWL